MIRDPSPILEQYLKKVNDKLPGWLKDKKEESQEVLDELAEHIWNKAEELAQGNPVEAYHMQGAVDSMGTPESLAKEYKKRGTPKFYVSEELYPYYKKTLRVVINLMILFNLFGVIFPPYDQIWEDIGNFFISIWGSVAIAIIIVSGIFILLSMEGFLPKDLGVKIEGKEKTKKRKKHHRVKIETKYDFHIGDGKKKHKHPIKPGELIAGGIFTLILGYLCIVQPFGLVAPHVHPQFLDFLRWGGILSVVEGSFSILRGIIGRNNIGGHQMFQFFEFVMEGLHIPLLIIQKNNPLLREFFFGASSFVIPEWVMILIIIFTVIGMMEKFSKIFRLKRKIEQAIEIGY